MGTMTTSIVGQNFYPEAKRLVPRLRQKQRLGLKREPDNKYDGNAIAVYILNVKVGHLSRGVAENLAPMMDAGVAIIASKVGPMGGMIKLDWDDEAVFRLSASMSKPRPLSEKFKPPAPPKPYPVAKAREVARRTFPELDFSAAEVDEGPDPWE